MQTQTTAAPPAKGFRKFGLLDKLSYAAGDFGCNMSFAMKSMITIYWTQMMGIDEILFAALLVVVQVWDGINDPILGTIVDADHHNYKRNKFLTYISAGSLGLTVVLFAASFGNGIGGCVMWAMVADALDYEEWKFGTRTDGTSYALYSLMRKIAQGVMPSLGLVAATFFGYEAVLGADQAPGVAVAMRYLMPAFYVAGALLSLVGYAAVYNLNRKTMARMTAELEARRAAAPGS